MARPGNNGWRQIFYEQVGRRVRDMRIAKALELGTCAEKMGVSPATLSRTESGDLACSLQLLARFASVVGCTPNDLIPLETVAVSPKIVRMSTQGLRGVDPSNRS